MLRFFVVLVFLASLCSCANNISGYYEHNTCLYNYCRTLELSDSGTFRYHAVGTHLEPIDIIGNYSMKFRRVILSPTFPVDYQNQKSSVQVVEGRDDNFTTIYFFELPPIIKKINDSSYVDFTHNFKPDLNVDTIVDSESWFRINNVDFNADSKGIFKKELFIGDTIEIPGLLRLREEFKFIVREQNIKELYIYSASLRPFHWEYQNIEDTLRFKRDRLYSIPFDWKNSVLGKKDFYNKGEHMSGMTYYPLVKEIKKSITENVDLNEFKKQDFCDQAYLLYFKRNGKIRRVVVEPYGDTKLENWQFNFYDRKCRYIVKKSLKNITSHRDTFMFSTKEPILMRLDYDTDSTRLRAW